ncbi:hypothetical protein [Lactovum odontotermitis]
MTNFPNFENIYANLAESAYTGGRPNSFGILTKQQQQIINSGLSARFNFSQSKTVQIRKDENGAPIFQTTQGGTNLPNDGIVYLQPAIKISTHTYTSLPNPNDSNYNPKIFREAAA